jgi:hypothetical protein
MPWAVKPYKTNGFPYILMFVADPNLMPWALKPYKTNGFPYIIMFFGLVLGRNPGVQSHAIGNITL